MAPDPIEIALILGRILEQLGVRYCVGGSVASSVYGEARTTLDVDIVAELRPEHVDALVAATRTEFHVLEEAVRRAVRERSSFNAIHEQMLIKADVYVPPDDALHRDQLARRRQVALRATPGAEIALASPEDVVIHKLRWYDLGGRVSDRQWRDVLGVLKIQGTRLDREYMARVTESLGLGDLLRRARSESGVS